MNLLKSLIFYVRNTKLYKSIYRLVVEKIINTLSVNNNKIVFISMNGAYGCNPKYICEEIIRRKLPYKLVWVTNLSRKKGNFPREVQLVPCGLRGDIERSTSRVMICNARTPYFSNGHCKKANQIYIQTWHGSYGIKKMEGDCPFAQTAGWLKASQTDSANIDCLLSCCSWLTETYIRSFFCSREVIKETGSPRNDIFFHSCDDTRHKVRRYFNLTSDIKIALYAPTFRDNSANVLDCYQIDYEHVRNELTLKLGGEWVIITRLHPLLRKLYDCMPPDVINGCLYPDIQELMSSSDLMITDYSSCIFDFMLTRRPGFIFATDIEKYNTDRGFYYPLETTPFPIATNNAQLIENIRNFDVNAYVANVDSFLRKKGSCDDGHASARCVDYIESLMNGCI